MFEDYVHLWRLIPDGEPLVTATSGLLPVRFRGMPAMLKIALLDEEKRGGHLMRWWDGDGAAKVLAHTDDAILMERAANVLQLADMARNGEDDVASKIICATTAKLHRARQQPRPGNLMPLRRWFLPLFANEAAHLGLLKQAASVTQELLAHQQNETALHGDIHHNNVLDFGPKGWRAIDPKALLGDRAFDYANVLCNPDHQTALRPGRLEAQVRLIAKTADLEPRRLLKWAVAWSGLSVAFLIEDGASPALALEILQLAYSELSS